DGFVASERRQCLVELAERRIRLGESDALLAYQQLMRQAREGDALEPVGVLARRRSVAREGMREREQRQRLDLEELLLAGGGDHRESITFGGLRRRLPVVAKLGIRFGTEDVEMRRDVGTHRGASHALRVETVSRANVAFESIEARKERVVAFQLRVGGAQGV